MVSIHSLSPDLMDYLITFMIKDMVSSLQFGRTCKYFHNKIYQKEKWQSLDFYDLDTEHFYSVVPYIGHHIISLKLGSISTTLRQLKYLKSLRTLIIKYIPDETTISFWEKLSLCCPQLTSIEIHSPLENGIEVITFILTRGFPNMKHLIIAYQENYLHTQYIPETIHRVIELLEDDLRPSNNCSSEKIFQSWVTLQYLYRKIGDLNSSERIIQLYGPHYRKLDGLKSMTDRVMKTCSRPEDRDTCYFWHHCYTCKLDKFYGLCGYCVDAACHKGHKTAFKYISTSAYCDCKCQHPT